MSWLRTTGVLLLAATSLSCSTMTPEEREYADGVAFEKWTVCHGPVHVDHIAKHHKKGHWSINQDLAFSRDWCRLRWAHAGY